MEQDVRILSQHDDGAGTRIYQLSLEPDHRWWGAFHTIASRRLDEVGMHPSASVEKGHGGDEIRISGIAPETSVPTDQWLARVVRATNTESGRSS